MGLIHKLKYRLSEPYRIRIGVGLSPLRNEREYNALIDFCREELKDEEHMRLNPDRKALYEATLKLHGNNTPKGFKFTVNKNVRKPMYYNNVYNLVEDHVGWYWN